MSTTPPLDPEPWFCLTSGFRHEHCHEGYVYWEPREGYAQDEDDYPAEIFEEGD